MVVTKPEGEDTQVANKPKEGEKPPITSRGGDDDGEFQFGEGKLTSL